MLDCRVIKKLFESQPAVSVYMIAEGPRGAGWGGEGAGGQLSRSGRRYRRGGGMGWGDGRRGGGE